MALRQQHAGHAEHLLLRLASSQPLRLLLQHPLRWPLKPLQPLQWLRQYQRHRLLPPALLVHLWAQQWLLKCLLRFLGLPFRLAMWAKC